MMMEKIGNWIFHLKSDFGISYGISPKYRPIWVSVSVSDLNQNSCFGCTLYSTSTNLLITNSTSTNFMAIALKLGLVEFIQVGDTLYINTIF